MAKQPIPGFGFWTTIAALINGNFNELYHKVGDDPGWVDIVGNLSSTPSFPQSPDWVKLTDDGAASEGILGRGFDDTSEESLLTTFHLPHGIIGTEIYPHVHWSPLTTGTGVVRWGFEYIFAKGYAQQAFLTTSYYYVEQAAGGTTKMHEIAENSTGLSIPGLETDGLLMMRLFRDATHANDTYVGDAVATFVDLHAKQERLSTPNRNYPFD